MKIILAGFNIESEMVERLAGQTGELVTPEVISAAYARISRDPRSVDMLRREAREEVDRARRSNETIIFGLGHSSIAEHAVFNFDIMDVSRLAVEEIEHFRLASFTEKSQRYIRLGRDFVIPDEISNAGLGKPFERLQKDLHEAYEQLLSRLLDSGADEGVAREDARYVMPLATSAQLGMTVNARELEYMVSRLASHPLAELRLLSSRLSEAAKRTAPSLIRYPEPTDYSKSMQATREELAILAPGRMSAPASSVRLIEATPHADLHLSAALIFSAGGAPMKESRRKAERLGERGRADLITKTFKCMQPHDSVWREFEQIHFLFELVVSASCFAQLKRHRMATIIKQRYEPALGISIPPAVRKARAVTVLRRGAAKGEKLYNELVGRDAAAAAYALTNAHRRRVLLGLNLRELYHFSRLRSDLHAQWEIRMISDEMCRAASARAKTGAMFLGGKDTFEEKRGGTT
jgi:flavin-dependent thymidylate synthase